MPKRETYTMNGRKFDLHLHVTTIAYSEILKANLISSVILGITICISVLMLIFTYESPYIYDPILSIKNNFLELQFSGLIISIILLIIGITKRKNSKNTFKFFIVTTLCLIAINIAALCGMISFENKYNEETFAEMYNESYFKVDVTGDRKTFFVDECIKLNEKFEFKVITYSVMQYILILVNLYLLYTELKLRKKYEQIEKENEVLFDEEQNVKI